MTDPVDNIELALKLAKVFCNKGVEVFKINGMFYYRHNLPDVLTEAMKQHGENNARRREI